jgi:hypothetical protein
MQWELFEGLTDDDAAGSQKKIVNWESFHGWFSKVLETGVSHICDCLQGLFLQGPWEPLKSFCT